MHVYCSLTGGLGNLLFQMAAAWSYGKAFGFEPVIHKASMTNQWHGNTHADTVFAKYAQLLQVLPDCVVDEGNLRGKTPFPHWHPFTAPSLGTRQVRLSGYFQSEKYFTREYIDTLTLPETPLHVNTCFLHVRRGDYISHLIHRVDLKQYYVNAIAFICTKHPTAQVLVFSDDIDWCATQDAFTSRSNVSFCSESDPVKALSTMAACELGGICANSSFSWWGAYLNPNPLKTVVFPSVWMNGYAHSDDLYAQNSWVMDCDACGACRYIPS